MVVLKALRTQCKPTPVNTLYKNHDKYDDI